MEKSIPEGVTPLDFLKRIIYLAWQACGAPAGMGVFQDRGPLNEDQVWELAYNRADYPGMNDLRGIQKNTDTLVHCDYVAGRMMKTRFETKGDKFILPQGTPRSDYQSWCRVYPTYEALYQAAFDSFAVPA